MKNPTLTVKARIMASSTSNVITKNSEIRCTRIMIQPNGLDKTRVLAEIGIERDEAKENQQSEPKA